MVFDTKNYDLPEDSVCAVGGGGGGNSKFWMSSDVDDASPIRSRDRSNVGKGCSVSGSTVDLLNKKGSSSFTRCGPMVYTKNPCTERNILVALTRSRRWKKLDFAFIAAVPTAKERQGEESMAFAAQAKLSLQAFKERP